MWYVTKEELMNNTPSRRDGMSYEEEMATREKMCKAIIEIGIRLKMYV